MLRVSTHPQLFLDDYLIDELRNVRRELQSPVKHPDNPLIIQEHGWEANAISVYGTVLHDAQAERFHCWYLASRGIPKVPDTPEGSAMSKYYTCYAESPDGIGWTKPMVNSQPFGGFQPNNIVIPGSHSICVIETPEDPDPNRRFKAGGGGVFGFSPDGINWDVRSWRDVIGKNDTGTSIVRWGNKWIAFVRNQESDDRPKGNLQRAVAISESDDFEHWTPKKTIWMTDATDGHPWTQPYGLCVTAYGDQLIGVLPLLRLEPFEGNNSVGDMELQLMSSRDGRSWQRVADRTVLFDPSPNGPIEDRPWDNYAYPSSTLLNVGDQVRLYYSGTNGRHGEGKTPEGRAMADKRHCGIGLATLAADRFVALRPDHKTSEPAVLRTKPLTAAGNALILNADLGLNGRLEVELLDAQGHVQDGFDRGQCRLVPQDALRYRVTWGDSNTSAFRGDTAPLALRFIWTDASLFAFQII